MTDQQRRWQNVITGPARPTRKDEPWSLRLGPRPTFLIENTETGETYWPTPEEIRDHERFEEIADLRRQLADVRGEPGPQTVGDKLRAARELLDDALGALGS